MWKSFSINCLIFRDFLGLKSILHQNFGTICHTEVCLTFSRLAAKLSELPKTFRGQASKIQPQTFFDLNGLKHGLSNHFDSSLKSMHLFQRLMGAMNCRYIEIAKKQNVLSSEEWFEVWTLFLLSCMGFYFSLNMARRKLIKLSLLHLNLMCIEIIDHISYVSDMFY